MSFINDSYPYGMLVLDDSKQYYIYSQVGHSNSVVVSTGIIRNLCVPTTTFKGMDTNTLQTDQLYTIGLSGTQASIPNILFNTLSGSTMSWASGALPEITSTECNTNLIETTNAVRLFILTLVLFSMNNLTDEMGDYRTLRFEDNGNLAIYNKSGTTPLWSTNTLVSDETQGQNTSDRHFSQSDGVSIPL